jgi:predicted phage tail protein
MTKFNLVDIHNPLEPRDHHLEERTFEVGQSLAELFPVGPEKTQFMFTVNGLVVEDMAATYPVAGDYVTRCPIPEGGGGAIKNILRIVALIIIMIYAPYLAGFIAYEGAMAGVIAFGMMDAAAMALTVAITVGGSMMVNSLLAPPKPSVNAPDSSAQSPTYGIDGAKNTSAEGVPVPLVYGTHRFAGNIISNYTINDGDSQWLYMLLNAGEGPVAPIAESTVLVNEQPLSSYQTPQAKPEFEFLPGTADQQPPKWFGTVLNPVSVGKKFTTNWGYTETNVVVDGFRVDVTAPSGLFLLNEDGSSQFTAVGIEIQYRPYRPGNNTLDWATLENSTNVVGYTELNEYSRVTQLDDNGTIIEESEYVPKPTDVVQNGVIYDTSLTNWKVIGRIFKEPVYEPSLYITGKTRSAHRQSIISHKLAQDRYEIRYRRIGEEDDSENRKRFDSIYVADVVGVITDKVGYRNTALVALRFRLNDHLNGIPNITFLHHGKLVQVYRDGQWFLEPSSNPAWIAYDILTSERYGGGAARSRIDIEAWKDWAEHCVEKGLEFNGVFDVATNVWDAVNQVARCGHGQVVPVGTRYTVLIEREDTPVMMFNTTNMVSGSFKESWLSLSDRANEVELTYTDRNDNYAERTIRVLDTQAQSAGQMPRKSQIQIKGITSAERAYQEVILALNMNRHIRRTITFSAPIDAIACTIGSVILVQHSMPQWGEGGRTMEGSSGSVIKLDRAVRMEAGKDYELLVHLDAMQRWSGTIKSVVGNTVLLNAFDGTGSFKRFLFGDADVEVLSVESIGTDYGIRLDNTAGLSAGLAAQLWDTNVIIRRGVLNTLPAESFIETDTVTLTASLGLAPPVLTKWIFGTVTKTAKPFRVRMITGTHEYTREIQAIEYNPAIYDASDLTVPELNYSSLEPSQVKSVIIEGVTEEQVLIGSVFIPQVTISFRSQQESYKDAEIFLSRNGGAFLSVGKDKSGLTVGAVKGEELAFRVVARNQSGMSQSVAAAASVTYSVVGRVVDPGVVTGISHSFTANGTLLKWNASPLPDWIRTEVRTGGADAATSQEVFAAKLNQVELAPHSNVGSKAHYIRHVATDALNSAFTTYMINVVAPATPAPQIIVNGAGSVTLSWPSTKTSQAIGKHRVRFGSTTLAFNSLTDAATISGNTLTHTIVFSAIGTFRVWVQAEDIGGITSAPGYVDVTVANLGQKGDKGDPGVAGLRSTYARSTLGRRTSPACRPWLAMRRTPGRLAASPTIRWRAGP